MLRGSLLIYVNQIPGAPMCSLILDIVTATGEPLEFLSLVASRYGTDVLATIIDSIGTIRRENSTRRL